MKIKYLYIIAMLFAFSACDKINEPFVENNSNTAVDTTKVYKKILVEDFTGHHCINCPAAHRVLQGLHDQYGERIIGVAIHYGSFASATNWASSGYTYNFKTPEGTEIGSNFLVSSTPTGMINRRMYNSSILINKDDWGSLVNELLPEEAKAKIEITNTYIAADSSLSCAIKSAFLADVSEGLSLVAYLVEDSIVKPQLDGEASPEDVLSYTHRHVLRGTLNSTWGEAISPTTAGSSTTKTYTFSFKNKDFVPSKCAVVAYLMNTASKADIIQVEMAKVVN
ncbi:MAG: Omp28 family outer membrane lipoprotein [Bacteroidota bacterium]